MKQYFSCMILAIVYLTFLNQNAPAFAKPLPRTTSRQYSQQSFNLKLAIDRFFKTGALEESWFSVTEFQEPEQFDRFRKKALDSRKFILQLAGAYKSVRSESDSRYIITFEKRELGLEFKLDSTGRIKEISGR